MGAVMIGFGGLGLLSAPLTLVSKLIASSGRPDRVQTLMWTGPFGTWMMVSLVIATAVAALLVVSGVGVLKRRAWARRSAIVYGVTTIAVGVMGQIVNILYLYPALVGFIDAGTTKERAGAVGGLLGGTAGALLGMALPITVLVVMTRSSVKAELCE